MALTEYRTEVWQKIDGARHGETQKLSELQFVEGLSFSKRLNDVGECSFTMKLDDEKCTPENIAIGQNEIKIFRNNELVWAGLIVNGIPNLQARDLQVSCETYETILKNRLVEYYNITTTLNKSYIAQELVQHSQFYKKYWDIGVRIGLIQGSGVVNEFEKENEYILDIIQELSETNDGFDFEITDGKAFNVHYPSKGQTKDTIVFEWGVNISDPSVEYNANSLMNWVKVIGKDGAVRYVEDVGFQKKFYGRQGVLVHRDISDLDLLKELGLEFMRVQKNLETIFNFTILPENEQRLTYNISDFETGDVVKLKIQEGNWARVNNLVRIYGWEVSLDNEGNEQTSLEISQL